MDFFSDAKEVWDKLADDESREIYTSLVMYNLTKDLSFFSPNLEKRLRESGIDIYGECKKHAAQPKIIWGAGAMGGYLFDLVSNVDCRCYGDNKKQGTVFRNLPVLSAGEIKEKYPDAFIVVSVIKDGEDIKNRLTKEGFDEQNIMVVGKVLQTAESDLVEKQYFDLPYLTHDDNEVFVDCGVLDAMSSLRFAKWANNKYKHIYLFEANNEFCVQSRKNLMGGGSEFHLVRQGRVERRNTVEVLRVAA